MFPCPINPIHRQVNSATSGTTLLGTDVCGDGVTNSIEVFLDLTGSLGGDANAQLPTVYSVVGYYDASYGQNFYGVLLWARAGQTYKLRVINESSHIWTITTNTGWTLNGTMAIQAQTWREFMVTINTIVTTTPGTQPTATLQNIGSGTL